MFREYINQYDNWTLVYHFSPSLLYNFDFVNMNGCINGDQSPTAHRIRDFIHQPKHHTMLK